MIIEVNQGLLNLIKQVEASELEASGLELSFSWSYYEDGLSASGQSWVDYPHAEYEVGVSTRNTNKTVQCRGLGKYDNDGWETHELDSEYEAEAE